MALTAKLPSEKHLRVQNHWIYFNETSKDIPAVSVTGCSSRKLHIFNLVSQSYIQCQIWVFQAKT